MDELNRFITKTYFQIPPIVRGLLWAGAGFLLIEFLKPGLFFAGVDDGDGFSSFLPRGFEAQSYDGGETIIEGTWLPWWAAIILLFVIGGLFI